MNEFVSVFLIWVKAESTCVDCVFEAVDYAVFFIGVVYSSTSFGVSKSAT